MSTIADQMRHQMLYGVSEPYMMARGVIAKTYIDFQAATHEGVLSPEELLVDMLDRLTPEEAAEEILSLIAAGVRRERQMWERWAREGRNAA